MHPFSVLTLAIFVAGYITARWDLVTRLYELVVFAWDHGVVVRIHLAFEPHWSDRVLLGTHTEGLCYPFSLLLLIRHTDRKTGLQGDCSCTASEPHIQ